MNVSVATTQSSVLGVAIKGGWTSTLVQVRLVEAFSVLARSPMRILPKGCGNSWMRTADILEIEPELIKAARVDVDAHNRLVALRQELDGIRAAKEQDQREQADRNASRPRPTAQEVALADEALHWATRYLRDMPMHADALQLWALCGGMNLSMARMLRERVARADELVAQQDDGAREYEARMEERRDEAIQNHLRDRVVAIDPKVQRRQMDEDSRRENLRREIIAKTVAWANDRLGRAVGEAQRGENIRANARIKAAREIGGESVKPVRVRREDVLPGRVFTKSALNKFRKEGAAHIAHALNKAGVEVR